MVRILAWRRFDQPMSSDDREPSSTDAITCLTRRNPATELTPNMSDAAGYSKRQARPRAHRARRTARARLTETAMRKDRGMGGLYYEDFVIGATIVHEIRRTMTEMDNVLFSTMSLNPQPLHLDAEFSKTHFSGSGS